MSVLVQKGDTGASAVNSGSVGTLSFGSNTTPGNTLVLCIYASSATSPTVTPPISTSMCTTMTRVVYTPSSSGDDMEIWVGTITGAAKTLTVTTNGAVTWSAVGQEWPGRFTPRAAGTVTGTGTSVSMTITGARSNETIIACANVNNSFSVAPSGSWTDYAGSSFWALANGLDMAWEPTAASTSQTATWTCGSAAFSGCAIILSPGQGDMLPLLGA
jgi:hypothetical protein